MGPVTGHSTAFIRAIAQELFIEKDVCDYKEART
jgi:hypothetical protein